jgi:V-ATPase subunit H.
MVKSLEALSREKLIRVGYACFRNLSRDDLCLEIMIDSGLLKVLSLVRLYNDRSLILFLRVFSRIKTLWKMLNILETSLKRT